MNCTAKEIAPPAKKKVGWFCLKFIVSRTSAAAALKNTTKSLRKFKIENPDLNLKYPSISYQHKSARSPSPHPVSSQNSFLKQQIEIMLLEGNYRHPYSLSEIIFIHPFRNIQHKYLDTKNIVEQVHISQIFANKGNIDLSNIFVHFRKHGIDL